MSEPGSPSGAPAKRGFFAQLAAFPSTFWWANWMELVERFAYYGLRTVVPVYMVLAHERGGPELTHAQKGLIFAWWAAVQSFLPIFTGGFADRYGYKVNILISTVLKIAGYLVMGWAIWLGSLLTGMSVEEKLGAAGGPYTYPIFFAGALLLAAGTAIFKPGVQGLIAYGMPSDARSFGWGIFYQMVNVGGFLGPLFAAVLQMLSWKWVFTMCAVSIALNFVPLMLFPEPPRKQGEGYVGKGAGHIVADTFKQFLHPRVFFFTIAFAGFWLMFYQLFDILPNFIDDWVDSRGVVAALGKFLPASVIPVNAEGNLNQAWMINLDALLIMFFAFAVGYVTGKFKSLPTMMVGIAVCAACIYALGMSMNGWWTLGAIGVFAFGEMIASPTKLRFMNEIAPKGKEGLFLGFANATTGLGWFVGSLLAGHLYEHGGDKANLALQDLAARREAPQLVELLDEEELFDGYFRRLGTANLAGLTLVFAPETIAEEGDPRAVAAWLDEHWKDERQARRAREVAEAGGSLADVGEAVHVLPEHVGRLPHLEDEGIGAEELALARGVLRTSPEYAGLVERMSDDVVVVRLSQALGVSNFAAHRLLFEPSVRGGGLDLGALEEKVRAAWPRAPKEGALAALLEEVVDAGGDGVRAVLELAAMEEAPASRLELVQALKLPPPPVAEAMARLRGPILALATEAAATGAEAATGRPWLLELFKRSRTFDLAASEAGMDRDAFKQYLWDTYEPYSMWKVFTLIGLASMVALWLYRLGLRRWDAENPDLAGS